METYRTNIWTTWAACDVPILAFAQRETEPKQTARLSVLFGLRVSRPARPLSAVTSRRGSVSTRARGVWMFRCTPSRGGRAPRTCALPQGVRACPQASFFVFCLVAVVELEICRSMMHAAEGYRWACVFFLHVLWRKRQRRCPFLRRPVVNFAVSLCLLCHSLPHVGGLKSGVEGPFGAAASRFNFHRERGSKWFLTCNSRTHRRTNCWRQQVGRRDDTNNRRWRQHARDIWIVAFGRHSGVSHH